MKANLSKSIQLIVLTFLIIFSSCSTQDKKIIKEGKDRLNAWETHLTMEQNSSFNDLEWQFIGPKNTSGRMTDVAVSPNQD